MKKKMNRFLAMMMALLMVFSWIPVGVIATEESPQEEGTVTEENAYADATALEFFQYTVTEDCTVVLTKYTGSGKNVIVAPQYTLEGSTYATILDSTTVFKGNTRISTVKLYPGVGFANKTAASLFEGCTALTSVDMKDADTTGVTDMNNMFYNCTSLTSLDVTGLDTSLVTNMRALFRKCGRLASIVGYQDWDTGSLQDMFWMFDHMSNLKVVDLSKWDLSQVINSAWCFQNCYAKQILLPDNLKTMSAGFLNHANSVEGTTFTIPAGVEKIGYAHTIYDFATSNFVEFIVPPENKNYKTIDGILYSADGKEMLAVPRNKTFETKMFEVPEGVEFFGELSFSRNYQFHTLILPNSYEIVQSIPVYDPRYIVFEDIGNLNAGNSLTIALYVYTGVSNYAVKDDNPRYESIDGIIYSEDMTTVLAIPTRYNKLMNFPEGVTTWETEAMWGVNHGTPDSCLANCPGVYIPSTMIEIAQDQFDKLIRLNKRFANFEVTVHPDNPVYSVDTHGYLMMDGQVARNMTSLKAYTSLADALAEVKSGDTIALLDDVVLTEPIVINGGKVILDLCGKTISAKPPVRRITKAAAAANPAIRIQGDADVTVKNGTIESDSSVFALGAADGSSAGKLTVQSGNYTGAASVVSVSKGTLNISGGTFKTESQDDTVNLIDANCTDGSAAVSITGGTFYGLNPESFTTEGETSNLCATNYAAKANGDNSWTVETIFAATIVETGENYESLAQAVTAANELESATIQLLKNSDLAEKLTITGNVTIDGSGYTITRADTYTGTLFTVNADATLTLDGGLVIDGGNDWTYKDENGDGVPDLKALVDDYARQAFTVGQFIDYDPGAPKATAAVFTVLGSMEMKDVLVQNHAGSDSIVELGGNGALTTNKETEFFHNVGVNVIDMSGNSTFNMNGSTIRQNVGSNHGGCVRIWNGTMTMNGGMVEENFTTGQGSFARLDGGKLIIDDGTVQDNLALPFNSSGNNTGAAIDCKYGHIEMNGGTIQRNYGHIVGGVNHIGNSLTITGGSIVDNVAMVPYNGVYHNDIFYACTAAKPATITGGIFTTEIYGACTNTNPEIVQGVTPLGYEEFVIGKDAEGNANLWEVAPGWMITFVDEDGTTVLQTGPVRADTIPVFEGEIESRGESWGWSWDKELAPATEPATYTLVWTHYVAEVVKPGSTEPPVRYTTLADAVAAAEDGDTVRLLEDIPLAENLTVDGKAITLDGNGHTITRGKLADDSWYTGSLFAINAGAALTLDGGLVIDGGNNWTYKKTGDQYEYLYVAENYTNTPYNTALQFINPEEGGADARAPMFSVSGSLVLNTATIQNHLSTKYSTTGEYSVITVKSTGSLTMNDGAKLTHNAAATRGTAVHLDPNSRFDLNGGEISWNVGYWHGATIYNTGGYMVMNGGSINNNHNTYGMGSAMCIIDGRKKSDILQPNFIMNGGEICHNANIDGTGGGNGSAIYARNGIMEMHGGSIDHNYGRNTGGIDTHPSLISLSITGGFVVHNIDMLGKNTKHDIQSSSNTTITGGWFSHDVSQFVPETHTVIVHDFACDEDGTCDGTCECTCGNVCEADLKREHCITLYQVAPVIKVTMDDQVIIEGDEIPELTYTINYGIVEFGAVNVNITSNEIENPVVGENEITCTGKLSDGTDKAINYALKLFPGKLTILPKPECVEDTIVVDSGLPVSIDVMENDPVPNTDSTLVGLGLTAPGDMWPVTDSINQQLADGFVTELEAGLKYGTAKIEDGKVIYTPNSMAMKDTEVFYYALQYTGDLYRSGYYYGKVTVVPATSIYYEDNFLEYEAFTMADDSQVDAGEVWEQTSSGELTFPELDADRIYGNNPAYSNSTTYSLGSHYQATVSAEHYGTAKFDFWGTGFDLISACTFDTGVLMVSVYDKAAFDSAEGETTAQKMQNATPVAIEMVDTYWGYALNSEGQWVASQSSDALYQVPVIKMELPAYGNYTAIITASYAPFFDHNTATANYQLYIDAIRIYDPANDGADDPVIEGIYKDGGEGWPSYYELRNLILDAGTFDSLNEEDEISGIVYIDGNTALGGEAAIQDYTNFGPNNELYLGMGQGISFTLPDDDNIDQIHLAMKTLLGSVSSAEVKVFAAGEDIQEVEAIQLATATDLYYDISLLAGRTIVIYNASDAAEDLISITNIKITHTAKPTSPEEASPFKVTKRGATMALQSVNSSLPEISDPKATVVNKWNIVLGDDIGANFYVEAPKENAAMAAVKVTVAGQTELYDLYALTPDDAGLYKIPVNVAAAQMTEDITLQMVVDGEEYTAVSYTVQDYAKTILAGDYSDATKNLVKHMLNYGAAAQNYFGVNQDNLANAGSEIAYTAQYPAEYPQLAVTGKVSGVRFYGASAVFVSKVALRYYFEADSVEGVTFSVNGVNYPAVEKNGKFYVEVPGIAPSAYADPVVLTAQKDGQQLQVSYSPLTYMVRMSQKGQPELQALMNAMYGYYEAAIAYEQQAY